MQLHPALVQAGVIGGPVTKALFSTGLCLPSGSALKDADIDRVSERRRLGLDDEARTCLRRTQGFKRKPPASRMRGRRFLSLQLQSVLGPGSLRVP